MCLATPCEQFKTIQLTGFVFFSLEIIKYNLTSSLTVTVGAENTVSECQHACSFLRLGRGQGTVRLMESGSSIKGVVLSFTVHYDCVKCCGRIFNGAEKLVSHVQAGQSAATTTTYLVVAELLPGSLLLQPKGGRETQHLW